MNFEVIFATFFGGAFFATLYLWFREKLRTRSLGQSLRETATLVAQLERRSQDLELEKTKLSTELEVTLKHQTNQEEVVKRLRQEMADKFSGLASQALEGNNKQFLELAKSVLETESQKHNHNLEKKQNSIENLVKPLGEALEKYHKHSVDLVQHRERSFAAIELEIKKVAETNSQLVTETTNLTNALKRPHVRGRWGEVQLKNCIELAGMSEYCDVNFQDSVDNEDSKLRPDMLVKMPGNRVVVVDSKTPLDAFLCALEAKDETERLAQLVRHAKHVKDHVRQLAGKNYAAAVGNSADFTVMFLPNESFLYAALETQKDLVEYALEQKILIATPPTLIGLLKVIRYGWNEERLAENAMLISDAGKELHKRVCDFMDAYVAIGKHLEKATQEYDAGFSRLNSRVLVQAKRLEKLGAKSKKDLPLEMVDSELLDTNL